MKITSFVFNLSGNIAYNDNTSEPYQISYDSQNNQRNMLIGSETVFSGLVGSNTNEINDFTDKLLPAIINFIPKESGKAIRSFNIHLYGTITYDDNTSGIFDVEKDIAHVPNSDLNNLCTQYNKNVVFNSNIAPINNGMIAVDNDVGKNWEMVYPFVGFDYINIMRTDYIKFFDNGVGLFTFKEYPLVGVKKQKVLRMTNGFSWSEVLSTESDDDGGPASILDFENGLVFLLDRSTLHQNYKSYDYGLTWQPVSFDTEFFPSVYLGNGKAVAAGYKTYVTDDYGETWDQVFSTGSIPRMTYNKQKTNEVLYTNAFGTFLSTDYGRNWNKVSDIKAFYIFNIENIIFLGDYNNNNIYRSFDFGRTFETIYFSVVNSYPVLVGYLGDGLILIDANIYVPDPLVCKSVPITMSNYGDEIDLRVTLPSDTNNITSNGNFCSIDGKTWCFPFQNDLLDYAPWCNESGYLRSNDLLRTITFVKFNSPYEWVSTFFNSKDNVFMITNYGIYRSV